MWGPASAVSTAALASSASDLSLVIGPGGVIEDVAVAKADLPAADCAAWLGKPWSAVVAPESAAKVQMLLHDAASREARPWRHVNHLLADGGELPIQYQAAPLGSGERIVAFGRDMRDVAQLQQRLVEAQQVVERDYWRLRSVETRYRLLFDLAADGLVIVDAAGTNKVLEANEAAALILGVPARRLIGQAFPAGLPERGRRELNGLITRVRTAGRAEELVLRLGQPGGALRVSVSPFAQDDQAQLLVRLQALQGDGAGVASGRQGLVARATEQLPDGLVIIEPDGRILAANPAFLGLVQFSAEDQVRGQSLGRWLGRTGVDLNVMLATVREQGSLRLFSTVVRGEYGAEAEVEISGGTVADAETPSLAFVVRHVGRRLAGDSAGAAMAAPRSVEQLTQLVGRRPLKELVRESTDLIEQLCIEAALQLTQDNRASAAEVLGVSRQSLYVKLRRYGLTDFSPDAEEPAAP